MGGIKKTGKNSPQSDISRGVGDILCPLPVFNSAPSPLLRVKSNGKRTIVSADNCQCGQSSVRTIVSANNGQWDICSRQIISKHIMLGVVGKVLTSLL